MNFEQFLSMKAEILRHKPDILDLSETRIHKAFADLRVDFNDPTVQTNMVETAYRCHLAEFWIKHQSNQFDKTQVLISQGVRHSLQVLMDNTPGQRWLIPNDVYPVYWNQSEAVEKIAYRSYPLSDLPDADFLLFCWPSRPRTEALTIAEEALIRRWLEADKNRRIVIDGVYDMTQMTFVSKRLIHSNQGIYLTSLSKSYLEEKVMGVCVVPSQDVERWTPIFRALRWENDKENFRKAQYLLTRDHLRVFKIKNQIIQNNHMLQNIATMRGSMFVFDLFPSEVTDIESGAYMHVTRESFQQLLDNNILSIPYSVFGGDLDVGVVSSLVLPKMRFSG